MTSIGGLKSILSNDQTYRSDIKTNNTYVRGDLNVTGDMTLLGTVSGATMAVLANAKSTGNTIPPGANQVIKFQSVQRNIGGCWDTVSKNLFTANSYGFYNISFGVVCSGDNQLDMQMTVNTVTAVSQVIDLQGAAKSVAGRVMNVVWYLQAGDEVQFKVDNQQGVSVNLLNSTFVSICKLSDYDHRII